MDENSLWLGRARKPVKYAMIAFGVLTLLLYVWLIYRRFVDPDAVAMHEMIRPEGRPVVQAMLVLLAGSILFGSLYLSDYRESIETDPRGFFDIVSLVLSRIAMITTGLIVVVMFYEVVSRYVFSRPTLWANELSLWMAAFVFLLAGLYAMQQRCHIRIYIIYDMMPRWMKKTADTISVALIVIFTVALIWGDYNGTLKRFLRMETFGTAWDPPIPGIVKPAVLLIITLVAIQAVSNLIADWNREEEHHSPADDIDQTEIENIKATLR